MSARESGQVRKEAALSGHRYAQRGFPGRSYRRRQRPGTSSRLRVHGPLLLAPARYTLERNSTLRRMLARERWRSARLARLVRPTVNVPLPAAASLLLPRPIVTEERPLPSPARRASRAPSV